MHFQSGRARPHACLRCNGQNDRHLGLHLSKTARREPRGLQEAHRRRYPCTRMQLSLPAAHHLCELEEVTLACISQLVSKCPLFDRDQPHAMFVHYRPRGGGHLEEFPPAPANGQCFYTTDQGFLVTPRLAQPPANTSARMESNLAHVRYHSIPPPLTTQPLVHLRHLDLMHINITGDAVDGIIANAPKIRKLVLAKCTALTDKAVKSIWNLGRHLHCLHLGHAAAITGGSVILLAKLCPRLHYVDLAGKSPEGGFRHIRQPQTSRF